MRARHREFGIKTFNITSQSILIFDSDCLIPHRQSFSTGDVSTKKGDQRPSPPGRLFGQQRCLSVVRRHLFLVALFVLSGFLVPLLPFFVTELLELFGDEPCNLAKGRFGTIFLHLGPSIHGIQEVSTHVPLWGIWILLCLLLSTSRLWGRNIALHLVLVSHLICLGLLQPFLHFLIRESLVLRRENSSLQKHDNTSC